MRNIFSLIMISSLLFLSCKKEVTTNDNEEESISSETSTAVTDSLETTSPNTAAPVSMEPNKNSIMYGQTSTGTSTPANTVTTTTVPPPPPSPQKVAKGMNPAHGQPGHRCDIAVGAPLNSAAKKITVPNQTKPGMISSATTKPGTQVINGATVTTVNNNANATTAPPATVAAPPAVVTAPGMNPPHGQEGHDCKIAVGAPLPAK